MPKKVIIDNKMKAANLQFPLSSVLGMEAELALHGVRPRFEYSDKQRTDNIIGYFYSVTDRKTLSSFDVRVDSCEPVISQKELDELKDFVYVEIPLDETFVRPYKMEFSTAMVSIVAPYLKLAYSADSAES